MSFQRAEDIPEAMLTCQTCERWPACNRAGNCLDAVEKEPTSDAGPRADAIQWDVGKFAIVIAAVLLVLWTVGKLLGGQ